MLRHLIWTLPLAMVSLAHAQERPAPKAPAEPALPTIELPTPKKLAPSLTPAPMPQLVMPPAIATPVQKPEAAADSFAADLVATRRQDHRGHDGSRPMDRVQAAGVSPSRLRENVSSYARSVVSAHASFLVDWGGGPPTGVQEWPTPGHRFATLDPDVSMPPANAYGASWTPATTEDPTFGPFVLVEEYARLDGVFAVGTVWRDLDGDAGYDPGEGIGGVEIRTVGGDWYTVTAGQGGFVLPVTAGGEITVQVGLDSGTVSRAVRVGDENVLVDVVVAA